MADVISFSCNFCGTLYRVPFAQAGKSVQCKQCKHNVNVPTQSQALAPGPLETSVEMNAGDQVLRKETSARRAPAPGISNRTARVTSGRTVSVHGAAPVNPLPVVVPPQETKSAAPIIIVVAVVAVLGALVLAIILLGTKETGAPDKVAATNSDKKDAPKNTPELTEADKIRRELDDPMLTAEKALALYRRAQDAKLGKNDLAEIARRLLNKLYDENGGKFTGAQCLAFIDEFSGYDLATESARLIRLLVARESETSPDGKLNETFLRMQKALGREKFDFENLIARSGAVVDAEMEGASAVHSQLGEFAKFAKSGWVESQDAPKVRDLVTRLEKLEQALKDLELANPTLAADRATFKAFKQERAARAAKWTFVSSRPFMIFVQLTEAEKELGAEGEGMARDRAAELRTQLTRVAEAFFADWVEPLGLKRALPADVSDQERARRPIELVLCRDLNALRSYASYIGESLESSQTTTSFYSLKVQRVCVDAAAFSGTQQVTAQSVCALNVAQLLFNHYSGDPLLRDEDQKARGIFHSLLLDRALLRCFLTPVRANSRIYLPSPTTEQRSFESCRFFDDIRGLNELLAKWRKPFARGAGGRGIDSFGGPAINVRSMVEMASETQGQEVIRNNFLKMPGIDEGLAKNLSEGDNYRRLIVAYSDALVLFLYHFERGGKPVYREGLLKYVAKDLAGMKREDSLKAFEDALGLDAAKWKQLEEDFDSVQK